MTRLLLTGLTGFLGSHVARGFLSAGVEVVGIKRPSSSLDRLHDVAPKITFVDYEGRVDDLVTDQIGPVDAVIHMATRYDHENSSAIDIIESNIIFPINVLEVSFKCGADTFINIDTFFSHQHNYDYLPRYSMSKRHFCEWGKVLANKAGLRFLNVRLEHLYGPGDALNKFVPTIIKSLLSGQPELKLTSGEQKRDFIFIDDAVQALLALVCKRTEFKQDFFHIGLGTGRSTTILDFVRIAHQLTKSETKLSFGALPYRAGEIMSSSADISFLTALGWSPAFTPESGLAICIAKEVG